MGKTGIPRRDGGKSNGGVDTYRLKKIRQQAWMGMVCRKSKVEGFLHGRRSSLKSARGGEGEIVRCARYTLNGS